MVAHNTTALVRKKFASIEAYGVEGTHDSESKHAQVHKWFETGKLMTAENTNPLAEVFF